MCVKYISSISVLNRGDLMGHPLVKIDTISNFVQVFGVDIGDIYMLDDTGQLDVWENIHYKCKNWCDH